jgi:hypothetical protein
MKVNIFRRMVKGRGTMRSMKSVISATSSRKTCMEVSSVWSLMRLSIAVQARKALRA